MREKVSETAGKVWNALNGIEGLAAEQVKRTIKLVGKDLSLSLGWPLRKDKISTQEIEGEISVALD